MLPLEELYAFKEAVAKYWKKLMKPSLIQSIFGDMVLLMLLLSVFHRYLSIQNMITGCFFMWVGFLIFHIVYRCLKGESIYEDYEKDE
jgi:hypothetical protein